MLFLETVFVETHSAIEMVSFACCGEYTSAIQDCVLRAMNDKASKLPCYYDGGGGGGETYVIQWQVNWWVLVPTKTPEVNMFFKPRECR